MNKDYIKVAVVDDGVNEKLYDIGRLDYNIEITNKLEILHRKEYNKYLPSHGTICAGIIKKYAPEASLSSIKILNDRRKGLCEQLVEAIKWCVSKKIRIVNLSVGTAFYMDRNRLKSIINYAVKNGTIIIAAYNNEDIITYPASFSNVISVKCDYSGKFNEGEYFYNLYPYDGVDIIACSRHLLYKFNHTYSYTQKCNSFAAPMITAEVHNILRINSGLTLGQIKQQLMKNATYKRKDVYLPYLTKNLDWVENAVLFLIGSSKDEIDKTFMDFNFVAQIHIQCDCLCEGFEKIKSYFWEAINEFDTVDTVVIVVNNTIFRQEECTIRGVLKELTHRGKNVVYIDDNAMGKDLDFEISDSDIKIWYPGTHNYFKDYSCKELDMPVITVYDFDGNCLIDFISVLQQHFRSDGYNIVAAVDNCLGVVAGMEYSPLLHKDSLQEFDCDSLKKVCRLYNPDIMIYGIDALNQKKEYLNKVNDLFKSDICILISKDSCQVQKEFMDTICDREVIVLTKPDTIRSEQNSPQSYKTFEMSDKSTLTQMYEYILGLYA